MKEKLKAKFLPPHYLQDNYTKLYNLKQESKSVEEYTREFERLVMISDLGENKGHYCEILGRAKWFH